MKLAREIILYIGMAVILLLPRLPGLDSFSTLDEPDWLTMGANFYYALGQREFQNTVYEYQPAVTTMWIVTAAMLVYFPQYRGLGQGYLDYEKDVLDPFLLEHGKDPLVLLHNARLIQVLLIAALLLFVFYLLQRMIGKGPAMFAVLLTAFDPFFLGQSRLLNHEALLALFGIIAILAQLAYLFQGRRPAMLIISAVSAALAQLTKSSGLALLAPLGVILLIQVVQDHRAGAGLGKAIFGAAKVFGIWLAVLVAAYTLLWPGMWVAPGEMLYQVYGNAFSYAFRGARLIAIQGAQTTAPSLETDPGNLIALVYTIIGRTTPATWMGCLLGIALWFTRDRRQDQPITRWMNYLMLIIAAVFVLMFGLAQGRNSPHYTLSSYAALNLFAGTSWFYALNWIGKRSAFLRPMRTQVLALSIVLISQAASAIPDYYPYYFTYENPVLSRAFPQAAPQFPYGEGLELAAQYLSGLPNADQMTALSYYGRGCFSYFFPGRTELFKPHYVDQRQEQDLLKALVRSDFLVIYFANQGHIEKYDKLIGALEAIDPEIEIWLNGYKYVVVYRTDAIPSAVLDTITKR
jgi:hypothetical protein